MKKIIVRLDETAPAECVWRKFEADGSEIGGRGSMADLAALATGYRLWVLVPGTDVLLTRVSLPPGNRKQLLAAIPYALEEFLAAEVEDQHFAVGGADDSGALAVAVIARQRLEHWLELCREHGLTPTGMVPDVLAVPLGPPDFLESPASPEPSASPASLESLDAPEDADSPAPAHPAGPALLITADGLALVRGGPQDGFVLESDSLAILAGMPGITPESRFVVYHEGPAAELPGELDGLVAARRRVSDVSALLTRGIREKEAINLLQGEYRPQAHWEKHWRRWRLPAVLILALLLVNTAMGLRENQRLSQYSQQLHHETVEVYRAAFPGAQRVVNPRAQMENELRALRAGGGDSAGRGFLPLLEDGGPVLAGAGGMQLRGLRYRGGELDLELMISDLQALDELNDQLEGRGLEVDIRTATTRDDRVQARLLVRDAGL